MSALPKILVYDSGAGGLTIGKELLKLLPPIQLVFASDKTFFPYGDKADAELIDRICKNIEKLITSTNPDLVVIACNTASTIALEVLRQKFTTPFVGVVPAIKPAAKLSRSKVLGLLATPATSNRRYTHQLIEDFAQDCSVVIHGSKNLVAIAESVIAGSIEDQSEPLTKELHTLFGMPKGDEIDTIILACTHFPILRDALHQQALKLGKSISWVDSGQAIARRTADLLNLLISNEAPAPLIPSPQNISFVDCDPDLDIKDYSIKALGFLTSQK